MQEKSDQADACRIPIEKRGKMKKRHKLRLVIFGMNRAENVMDRHPEYAHWYMAGHFPGGAQKGDGNATIGANDQWLRSVEAIVDFMEKAGAAS